MDNDWSTLARLLTVIEASQTSNALNFSVGYWEASGANFTGASAVINSFICPSANRLNPARDDTDPSDTVSQLFGRGYGYGDYGATIYTDIDPNGQQLSASLIRHALPQQGVARQRPPQARHDPNRRGHRRHQQHRRHR